MQNGIHEDLASAVMQREELELLDSGSGSNLWVSDGLTDLSFKAQGASSAMINAPT
jgi:hypothetical protein